MAISWGGLTYGVNRIGTNEFPREGTIRCRVSPALSFSLSSATVSYSSRSFPIQMLSKQRCCASGGENWKASRFLLSTPGQRRSLSLCWFFISEICIDLYKLWAGGVCSTDGEEFVSERERERANASKQDRQTDRMEEREQVSFMIWNIVRAVELTTAANIIVLDKRWLDCFCRSDVILIYLI